MSWLYIQLIKSVSTTTVVMSEATLNKELSDCLDTEQQGSQPQNIQCVRLGLVLLELLEQPAYTPFSPHDTRLIASRLPFKNSSSVMLS